jgi:hypothetical protein
VTHFYIVIQPDPGGVEIWGSGSTIKQCMELAQPWRDDLSIEELTAGEQGIGETMAYARKGRRLSKSEHGLITNVPQHEWSWELTVLGKERTCEST